MEWDWEVGGGLRIGIGKGVCHCTKKGFIAAVVNSLSQSKLLATSIFYDTAGSCLYKVLEFTAAQFFHYP